MSRTETENIRMTNQRKVILEEVRKAMNHPTADEVYELVRKRIPKISIATVYRNLEFLSEQGLVNKLELGSNQKRFDHTLSEHYHIQCTMCGRIDDLPSAPARGIEEKYQSKSDYTITGISLEFTGICPKCRKK